MRPVPSLVRHPQPGGCVLLLNYRYHCQASVTLIQSILLSGGRFHWNIRLCEEKPWKGTTKHCLFYFLPQYESVIYFFWRLILWYYDLVILWSLSPKAMILNRIFVHPEVCQKYKLLGSLLQVHGVRTGMCISPRVAGDSGEHPGVRTAGFMTTFIWVPLV
jgi:hypothetical protein